MKDLFVISYKIILWFFWICGIVIAKGFWSTLFCLIPFYAWYLVIEKFLQMKDLI